MCFQQSAIIYYRVEYQSSVAVRPDRCEIVPSYATAGKRSDDNENLEMNCAITKFKGQKNPGSFAIIIIYASPLSAFSRIQNGDISREEMEFPLQADLSAHAAFLILSSYDHEREAAPPVTTFNRTCYYQWTIGVFVF